jgi:hypothetical protein
MHALYQKLKELDGRTFELFCIAFLKERHPGANIHRVDGKADNARKTGLPYITSWLSTKCSLFGH